MKAYYSYFKKEIISGLQYRLVAFSGLATNLFWGLIYATVYVNFYKQTTIPNITVTELMSYVWLNQIFFSLTYSVVKDAGIMNSIKSGEVSYELSRPINLYWWWYLKMLASRYASVLLRMFPIIILSLLLPSPYGLSMPLSPISFILFIVSLFFASLIVIGINMIITTIAFFSNEDKGISSFFNTIGLLFSGVAVPLPLLSNTFNSIGNYLPFRHIGDTAFRIYSGNIPTNQAIEVMAVQFLWVLILIVIGVLIMQKALNKITVQGG